MGFGLLVLGYLVCINLFNARFIALAAVLMFWGLQKLSYVNRGFRYSKYLLIPIFVLGILADVEWLLSICNVSFPYYSTLNTVIGASVNLLMLVFLTVMFSGVREVSREVELPKLEARALRQQIYSFLFYFPAAALELVQGDVSTLLPYITLVVIILGYVVYVLNFLLLFSCYRLICLPSDIDMPQTKSRIPYINEMRRKLSEKEDRALENRRRLREERILLKKSRLEQKKKTHINRRK